MKVCNPEEMRLLDERAVSDFRIPEATLMENAGLAGYLAWIDHRPAHIRRNLVVAGSGNNGGDGLVVARHLHAAGEPVAIALTAKAEKLRGAALINLTSVRALGIPLHNVASAKELGTLIDGETAVIDGLLGTGISRPVEGIFADAIATVNSRATWILSLDIPSGIHGATGTVMGSAIQADCTVTFGLPKRGNLLYPGFSHCGNLLLSHISFPPDLREAPEVVVATNDSIPLPERDPRGHKGSFGKALVVSGASHYYGAPLLSAMSVLKAGGGYSRLAAPGSLIPHIAGRGPEIVFHPLPETDAGSLSMRGVHQIIEIAASVDFVILGPGLSLENETMALVRRLVTEIDKPLLIDGDGIAALNNLNDRLKHRRAPTILTPHLGEMSRLTSTPVSDISNDPIAAVQAASQACHSYVVLKGAHSLIGYPDGRVFINLTGNPGMATAGSGDVLTGTIAGIFGLGLSLEESVRNGVYLHGSAGDLATQSKGADGIVATDIMEHLPLALKQERGGEGIEPGSDPGLLTQLGC